MPVHDWTRVDAGIFHDFHHEWVAQIKHALNDALKGTDYYALAEQVAGGVGPDVLTLQHPANGEALPDIPTGARMRGVTALKTAPPRIRYNIKDVPKWYASKKKSVTIRHVSQHRVVAVLEIVSPGSKASRTAMTAFVRKGQDLLAAGVHLSLVDLFPPTPRDPQGIHWEVWGDDDGDTFRFDKSKPLTCAAYIGGVGGEAFIEPVAAGEKLPDLPVFLTLAEYVEAPLEATYNAAFDAVPDYWRNVLDKVAAKPRRRRPHNR